MAISEATRAEVFRLDHSECQFWHAEPVPATDCSHRVHQGAGGLPPDHWINQPPNIAASCRACHGRFSGPGKPYRWTEFSREDRVMGILAPNGTLVPEDDLWFYNRERWEKTQATFVQLESFADRERGAAWQVAEQLLWLKEHGIAGAVNLSADWLDLAAQAGFSSTEARKRARVAAFADEMKLAASTLHAIELDVVDRLRKIDDEAVLCDIGGWFASLPPAEAWARFAEKYPGKERRKRYRAFSGAYDEVTAASEAEAMALLAPGSVIVKGGSVIRGTRQQRESE